LLNLIQALVNRLRDEEGQTFVEYGLILGALAVGILALLVVLGGEVETQIQALIDAI
jgi:pilus assembly protein Flp/PilA